MRLMLIAVLVALYGCCIDSPKNGIAVEKGHSPRRFQNTIPVGGIMMEEKWWVTIKRDSCYSVVVPISKSVWDTVKIGNRYNFTLSN